MADQSLAQAGSLKDPFAPKPNPKYTLRYKFGWRWRAAQCWTRYVLSGRHCGVTGLVEFVLGNHFFRAMQVRSELAALGEILAQHRPVRALEIGTARGGTLLFLTRLANPTATIVSIDLPGGKFGGGYSARRKWFYQCFARRNQRLRLIQGDSHSAGMLERAKSELGGELIDYLFIDGDHTYEGVKRDFELYSSLVRRGGIIALHDVAKHPSHSDCEVSRFWNEVRLQYRHTEIIEDQTQGWAGIGVLYVD